MDYEEESDEEEAVPFACKKCGKLRIVAWIYVKSSYLVDGNKMILAKSVVTGRAFYVSRFQPEFMLTQFRTRGSSGMDFAVRRL